MTNQTPPQIHPLSPDEISAAFSQSFSYSLGHLTFEKLRLEKEMQSLHDHAVTLQVDSDRLKIENANLIKSHISFENQIHNLQKELDNRPTFEDIGIYAATVEALEIKNRELVERGPTLTQSAALDAAKTEAREEKAASGK